MNDYHFLLLLLILADPFEEMNLEMLRRRHALWLSSPQEIVK